MKVSKTLVGGSIPSSPAILMKVNEVKKNPTAPILSDVLIKEITELCFRNDDPMPNKLDLIFVFASLSESKHIADLVEGILYKTIIPKVLISGGYNTFTESFKHNSLLSESEEIFSHIDVKNFANVEFYLEKRSDNTLANVVESMRVLDFSNYSNIAYIFKQHASTRGYLTLKKFVSQDTQLFQKTWPAKYPGENNALSYSNWYKTEFGRNRVWGEVLRIRKYGERGDIYYPANISSRVNLIFSLIKSETLI